MNEQEVKRIESKYIRLKNEIESNSNKVFELVKLMLTVTIGIITLGYTKWLAEYELVFLIPIFLIVSISLLVESQMNGTQRIASYLRTYLEPNLKGYKWESKLEDYRNLFGKKSKYSFSIISIVLGLSVFCYCLFVIQTIKNISINDFLKKIDFWINILVLLVSLVLLVNCIIKLHKTKKIDHDKKWKEVN